MVDGRKQRIGRNVEHGLVGKNLRRLGIDGPVGLDDVGQLTDDGVHRYGLPF